MPVNVQALQNYAGSLTAHRLLLYSVFSLGAVAAVVVNALRRQSSFYSVAVFLSRSNGSVVVLGNFAVLLALLCGRLLQQMFFGPLRTLEVERLYDRTWFFVTESLLAFTIFRDEFDVPFASMFGLLLFTKCFHWLLSDRIEWMDQIPYPGPPLSFHLRVNALFTLLWVSDCLALLLLTENMLAYGLDGKILFASELAVLLASLLNSFAKYSICLIDIRRASARGGENAPQWEDKSMWIFYIELLTDFLKLVTYLTFFLLVLSVYGLPLNIVRDVYITGRSFIMRCRDLVNYRTATRNMNERYPNATDAELNALSDRTCIICREEMRSAEPAPPAPEQSDRDATGASQNEQNQNQNQNAQHSTPIHDGPNMIPKRLPCGHVFHFQCLRAWLERQQNCPTCRHSVFESPRHAQDNTNRPAQFPIAGVQDQQNLPRGAAGGFFGRLVGAAGAPPIVPGQFAPGPEQGQNPQRPLAPARDEPPRLPRHQLFAARPERFQGFVVPGGDWVPWPREDDLVNDGTVPQAVNPMGHEEHTPSTGNGQASNYDADRSLPGPSQTEDGTNGQTEAQTASVSGVSHPSDGSSLENATSAREAARAAVLRRFGSSSPKAGASNLTPSVTTHQNTPFTRELPRTLNRQDSESTAFRRRPQGSSITPAFIPLYDPSSTDPRTASIHPSSSSSSNRDLSSSNTRQSETVSQSPVQPTRAQSNSGSRSSSVLPRSRTLRELREQLSAELLTGSDQLTREAVDERLRALETIESAAARCITELLRCRSMLPQPNNNSPGGEEATTPNENEGPVSDVREESSTSASTAVEAPP